METPKIFESEYRFCQILWAHEPVKSRELSDKELDEVQKMIDLYRKENHHG